MPTSLTRSWKDEFALAAATRKEDILHREKIAIAEATSRQRIDAQVIQQKRREQERAAIEAALAPPQRIAVFTARLDTYDAKTVEALMDNEKAIDAVRNRLDEMLGKAHVLPDGRRVFKTADGTKVFDEHGRPLSNEMIDPHVIDDTRPKWEAFKAAGQERDRLAEERRGLFDYQKKLDTARERADGGQLTEHELTTMQDDVSASMPDRVRSKLAADDPAANRTAPDRAQAPADMDSLMTRTGLGPVAPGPG